MKKELLTLLVCAGIGFGHSQNEGTPLLLPNYYFIKISDNGRWLCSRTNVTSIYDVDNNETVAKGEWLLGLGNIFTQEGVGVGSLNDKAVIVKNGTAKIPSYFEDVSFSDFGGITPDGTRVCGTMRNPIAGVNMVPFYCDIDDDGNPGAPVILPHPELDFYNSVPQFITAVWISDDGKTIAGQVQDDYGYYATPIVYREGENGEWNYSLPGESLFNPKHLEIPENPWNYEPPYPKIEDYMYPETREFYLQELNEAIMAGLPADEYPDPFDYMTEEQIAEYEEAADTYNDWYYGHEAAIEKYINDYFKVLYSSAVFMSNEMALSPDGNTLVSSAVIVNDIDNPSKLYRFSLNDNELDNLSLPVENLFPTQVLSDGTIVATLPIDMIPDTYILLPEATEFISVKKYFETTNPDFFLWMDETLPNASGIMSFSDDMSVFAGGLLPFDYADPDSITDYFYSSFVMGGNLSGVNDPKTEESTEILHVYNLQGVSLLKTKNPDAVRDLSPGIYIINGKKFILK